MLVFIAIFFVIIIAVGATAVLGLSFYFKSRTKTLAANNQRQFDISPPPSLFQPDAEEVRSNEREEEKQFAAKLEADERLLKVKKAENVRLLLEKWQTAPDRKTIGELLSAAAQCESAEIFSETAEEVVKIWRANRIENLTAPDLADLLDSHFRLLPQQERTSGAIFWLKREIAKLREKSEEIR